LDRTLSERTKDLVERCNRGERQAWAELHARYVGLITASVGRGNPGAPHDVEDVVQEVFLNLVKALRQYDPARPLEVYILEIARRVRISRYRQFSAQKRGAFSRETRPLDAHDGGDEGGYISVASPEDNQESALMKAQETRMLRKALAALSESCRHLLGLRYDQGLSYKEISAVLGEKESSLRVKAQRCLSGLSKQYSSVSMQEAAT
jgi:RNA polymerase sigma-70 factor, ECF subfamily